MSFVEKDDDDDGMPKAAKQVMNSLSQHTARAIGGIGSLIPTATLQNLTTRKYTLPDKTVASQVLMYRQLLHTNAKPGLKLSRPYQATPAQEAVKHMPWWEQGIDESGKMVISYDNLIVRLWLNGAILPYTDLLDSQETMIDEKGLPPVPHEYWVSRLGFQQPDPVTDFRSGGVLSLGMMVHMVESCSDICARFFPEGDAAVLPFGLTCINVTDMMAKFLMLAKSVDRMDALLSQKPFWRMFADPNAILALQELSMTMLCDVVVELGRERQLPNQDRSSHDNRHGEHNGNVTVFDFPIILETTETRVRDDLLGAGPKTVEELRAIAAKLRVKYQRQLEQKEARAAQQKDAFKSPPPPTSRPNVLENANTVAQDVFSKFKAASPSFIMRKPSATEEPAAASTKAEAPPAGADLMTANSPDATAEEAGWANVTRDDTTGVTTAVGEFCIDDDDDDDL